MAGCHTPPGGPTPALPHAGLVFPAAIDGSLPRGATRGAGRMRSAAPAGSTLAEGRAESPPAGRWTAPAGRSWVRSAVRAGGGGSRGAAGWRLAAGRRGGGVSAKSGRSTSTPLPSRRNGSAHGGMRCSVRRSEAGGMNHPTWGRGGPGPVAPLHRAAAAAARASPAGRGRGRREARAERPGAGLAAPGVGRG